MANNPQNSGAQAIQPPAIGSMASQNFGPSFSMQFRPLVPPQQQQFPPLGQNHHFQNNHVPPLPLSSSFTFNTSSFGFGQPQMHTPITPMGGQHWLPSPTLGPPAGMQPLSTNQQATSVPIVIQEASSDWQEYTAGDGRRYFYNKRTKQSSWEKPFELMTPLERADASTVWKEFTTAEGKKYYYNKETKQSKWMIPEELKLAREQAEKEASRGSQSGMVTNASAPPTVISSTLEQPLASASSVNDSSLTIPRVASSPVAVKPHSPVGNAPPILEHDTSSNAFGETVTPSPVSPIVNGAGKVNVTRLEEKIVDIEPLLYASKQEAKVAFKSLLESANVQADWSWEQAMRVIINDKRYGALKTLGERKQTFNEYQVQKKKLEAEERRLRQRKAKDDFMKMLEESKELTSSMRWSKAMTLFEDDKRYKAVERPVDREDLFQNYLVDLQKKEKAKAQEEKRQNRLEYRHFLENCGFIKVDTQWRKVKDRLEDDERCSLLEKIERLEIFQEYIRDLEKEEEEQRKLKKEQIKRVERKNRDEFHKMMEEHVVSGILTANTQWRDYFEKVKESVPYQAVASNTSGATAKDLFEDVAEELEKKYHDDKSRVKDAMKSKKVTIMPTWTFGDFKAALEEPLSDINLQLVFEELVERAKEKEKKENRKRRRSAKDFTELLYNIKEINMSSTWEECQQLFVESSEYRCIGDENFARVTFEEYVARLLDKAKEEEKAATKEKNEKMKDDEWDGEKKRRDKEKERKHRSSSSRHHQSDHRKSRKHESDNESKHKRHKRDCNDEELEDGEIY